MALDVFYAYFTAFTMLFVVFDAIGNVPIFYSLTEDLDPTVRRKTIQNSVIIAGIILVVFALGGKLILDFFHISVDDFRIAGGLILLIVAIEGLLGRVEAMKIKPEQLTVVPLATPLLAGPGSISIVMYLMEGGYGVAPTMVSIVANVALAWAILTYSDKVFRVLGKNGSLVFARIMSFILAALAVAMIREGILGVMAAAGV
ncbi:MAG: MarC family protein [Thermoprotei archaeon]|nr:MAG: MarC family protein [Thermoprotei archaeon]RLF19002.1 MAG: MarC family protein [Thermoprotei archaeon]